MTKPSPIRPTPLPAPAKPAFLPLLRELVRCYQAFQGYSDAHIRTFGLTPPQFDVIVTLGNTAGMTFKDLGEKTLITKGTLTGVVDRLTEKGLVRRDDHPGDGRCFKVVLTRAGEREFARVFTPHLVRVGAVFGKLSERDAKELLRTLHNLRGLFETAAHGEIAPHPENAHA